MKVLISSAVPMFVSGCPTLYGLAVSVSRMDSGAHTPVNGSRPESEGNASVARSLQHAAVKWVADPPPERSCKVVVKPVLPVLLTCTRKLLTPPLYQVDVHTLNEVIR